MNIEFRMPSLTAKDSQGQIRQLHSFLRQTVEQLNWAMKHIEAGTVETVSTYGQPGSGRAQLASAGSNDSAAAAVERFNTIKGLIIKSADIVNAYYTKIDSLLSTSGKYVAQSDFGSYQSQVTNEISAKADALIQSIKLVEEVANSADSAIKAQSSYIKYGIVGTALDDTGVATQTATGIEICDCQSLENEDGTTDAQRFARFTAYGLELFGDDKQDPVAYLSGSKLYIKDAEIKGTLTMGGYLVDGSYGLTFKWVGRS